MERRILLYPECPTGRNYLRQIGTVRDIEEMGVRLKEGLIVAFYDRDADGAGNRDDLLFEGSVHYDRQQERWYAVIDPATWCHESEERVRKLALSRPYFAK